MPALLRRIGSLRPLQKTFSNVGNCCAQSSGTHYTGRLAMRYDSQVFYDVSGPLVQWQLSRTMTELDITPSCRLADIGGGTGGFTHELAKRMASEGNAPQVTLVEPAEEMIEQAKTKANPALKLVHGDVETFLARTDECDRVMFKEVVHHIPVAERDKVFFRALQEASTRRQSAHHHAPLDTRRSPFPKFLPEVLGRESTNSRVV